MYGDNTGGGHLYPGKPGKNSFPNSWSAEKIMHETSDIATDPFVTWKQTKGSGGGDFTRSGTPSRWEAVAIRDEVEIKVIIEPAGEGIITSFPVKGPGVIINE